MEAIIEQGSIGGIVQALAADRTQLEQAQSPKTRVVTVRMDRELHTRLQVNSHEERVSINRLCVLAIDAALDQLEQRRLELAQAREGKLPVGAST
jgi:hypothetical protein